MCNDNAGGFVASFTAGRRWACHCSSAVHGAGSAAPEGVHATVVVGRLLLHVPAASVSTGIMWQMGETVALQFMVRVPMPLQAAFGNSHPATDFNAFLPFTAGLPPLQAGGCDRAARHDAELGTSQK
jgi:hypothetical protein